MYSYLLCVIHVTSVFFVCFLKYIYFSSNRSGNRHIIIHVCLEHVCYDGTDSKETIKANIINSSFICY